MDIRMTPSSEKINRIMEGPSIVILKEEVQQFAGQKIISVSGNTKMDKDILKNQTVLSFKSWGKHFLICFDGFTVKVHFLMFGSYRINEARILAPRLNLTFINGEINFYNCSIKLLEGDINSYYDWSVDVMNESWNPKKAKQKLKRSGTQMICDALLDQNIFAGVGNIIKNEVLYRTRTHPESLVDKIPLKRLSLIIEECSKYSFDFLVWKRNYELRKHWLAYRKQLCLRCNLPIKRKNTGLRNRQSYFCENCQILYPKKK